MSVSRYAALATDPICGNTALDPDSEARVRALREQSGDAADMGCQRVIGWLHAYRCLECGRWMHAECLRQHFVEHGDRAAEAQQLVEQLREALALIWEEGNDQGRCSLSAIMFPKSQGHHHFSDIAKNSVAALLGGK